MGIGWFFWYGFFCLFYRTFGSFSFLRRNNIIVDK